jgi:chromate transporter
MLGCLSFGGPAAQIAMMERELAQRRRWISPDRFHHALGFCQALPGPEAQQLATYLGWLLHGLSGGLIAGALFILPGFAVMLGLSYLVFQYGELPAALKLFAGIQCAVIALIWHAAWRFASRLRSKPELLILLGTFLPLLLTGAYFPYLALLALAIGALLQLRSRRRTHLSPSSDDLDYHINANNIGHPARGFKRKQITTIASIGLIAGLLGYAFCLYADGPRASLSNMAELFTVAALVTFGGAYAVLPFIFQHALQHAWLSSSQSLIGLALGESTPGPLVLVVVYVAFITATNLEDWGPQHQLELAFAAASVALFFTFLPSFLLILVGAPLIEKSRSKPAFETVLGALNALACAAVLSLAIGMSQHLWFANQQPHWNALLLSLASAGLLKLKLPLAWVLTFGGLLGTLML